MDREFVFGALRRFWWVVVGFVLLSALLGALPQPAPAADPSSVSYQATHYLLVSSSTGNVYNDPLAYNQLVLLSTTGEVPLRVAEALDEPNAALLASQVSASLDQGTGALSLTTTQATAELAVTVADAFADQLVTYVGERQDTLREARLTAALERLDKLEAEIDDLQRQAAAEPDDRVIAAQLDAKSRQYSVIFENYDNLQSDESTITITTLQRAQAITLQSGGGLAAPKSRSTRGVLGAMLGFAIGIAVALVLARVDRRIRTRAQAEAIFGGPASVIVPLVPNDADAIVVTAERHDQLSDAYRTLRNIVSFSQANAPSTPGHASTETVPGRAKITLVVSACSGDGKTDLALNLAAAMVETGKRTVIVNTDFRRPAMQSRLVGTKAKPSPFTLDDLAAIPAQTLLERTPVRGLAMLDLGGVKASPGDLARATARLLPELGSLADAVIIDTSPVGATAEVLELLPHVDTVLVVMRLDHTLTAAARRSMEVLRSLSDADFILATIGDSAVRRSYYYEYADRKERKSLFGRLRAKQ